MRILCTRCMHPSSITSRATLTTPSQQARTMDDEDLPKRKKKKGGLFGRRKRKKKKPSDATAAAESSFRGGRTPTLDRIAEEEDEDYSPRSNKSKSKTKKKKKKGGFGARIRRMVGGRKRNKEDDDMSGISFPDPNDPNYRGPKTSLDPDILAQVMSKDKVKPDDNADDYGRDPRVQNNVSFDSMEEEEMDQMSYGEAEEADPEQPGDLNGPVGLVLLLVDPDTLRFELLQLDFENPKEAKVSDVLAQISESVTERALRALEFHALVDRQGNSFGASSSLSKALTHRRRSKDILVALSKGVTTEHCSRLARPILGDTKVVGMLEINGYDVKGWTTDKKEEAELRDAKVESFKSSERKRKLKLFAMIAAGLLLLWILVLFVAWGLGPAPLAPLVNETLLDLHPTVDAVPDTTTQITKENLEEEMVDVTIEIE